MSKYFSVLIVMSAALLCSAVDSRAQVVTAINLIGSNPLSISTGSAFIDPGALVREDVNLMSVDPLTGEMSVMVVTREYTTYAIDPKVNTAVPGQYLVTYSAGSLSVSRTVVVTGNSSILTLEKSGDLTNAWTQIPITANMISAQGELNIGGMTNTKEFYRLKIRQVAQ